MRVQPPSATVLVVIPLYNAASSVGKAIDSILSQTYTDYRILVVDDGSTDGSGDIAAMYAGDKLTILSQQNSGPAAAMNRAIDFAVENQCAYIARMDADDLSLPKRLEIQHGLLDENADVAACSSNCYYIDSETEEIIGASTTSHRPGIIKWEIKAGLRGMVQGATLFRTSALVEVGGYRPAFRYAEETDLFLRLAERYELLNAKEFLYKIRLHKNSLSTRDVKTNVQYHFYALQCSKNRRANKSEDDFVTFVGISNPWLSLRVWHEAFVLRLWRSNMGKRNYLSVILASLLDPRRAIARILRKF